jgi:hypothetical protein
MLALRTARMVRSLPQLERLRLQAGRRADESGCCDLDVLLISQREYSSSKHAESTSVACSVSNSATVRCEAQTSVPTTDADAPSWPLCTSLHVNTRSAPAQNACQSVPQRKRSGTLAYRLRARKVID